MMQWDYLLVILKDLLVIPTDNLKVKLKENQ